MLRLASALDRTHACLVKSLKCELSDQELTVYLKTAPGVDPQLEVYTAEMRKTLLEEVCGVRLGFAVTSELPFTDAAGSAQEQQENGQAA
jgi:hypothetical protein